MHPEVKQDHPGSCPKCGMTLVPEKPGDDSHEDDAYQDMLKKFRIALLFSIPVFIISMSDLIPFLHLDSIFPKKVWSWIEFVLATPVVFYCGWEFFKRGWSSIRRWAPNMWTLISIGVGVAYLFSIFGLLFSGIFPVQFKDAQGNVHLYFAAAAMSFSSVSVIANALRLRRK